MKAPTSTSGGKLLAVIFNLKGSTVKSGEVRPRGGNTPRSRVTSNWKFPTTLLMASSLCVCVYVCLRVCMFACMYVCVYVCLRVCGRRRVLL